MTIFIIFANESIINTYLYRRLLQIDKENKHYRRILKELGATPKKICRQKNGKN